MPLHVKTAALDLSETEATMPEGSGELTARQRAVIERIERRVPIKTIAGELGISPTRVNQHVRALKDLYGVNSLGELVEIFRERSELAGDAEGAEETEESNLFTKDACPKDQFPSDPLSGERAPRDDSAEIAFSDALSFSIEAPWERQIEPAVVPGMLDGRNFVTARLLAMVAGAVGMVSLLVLVLTSLMSLGKMLEGRWYVPESNSYPGVERGRAEDDANGRSGQPGRMENKEADA
jgi:DNA-binding CsgD family transcriptional regulator